MTEDPILEYRALTEEEEQEILADYFLYQQEENLKHFLIGKSLEEGLNQFLTFTENFYSRANDLYLVEKIKKVINTHRLEFETYEQYLERSKR